MTVASEIARIQGVKSNILNAIAAKGVTVPSGAMLADCPNLISSISGGGGGGAGEMTMQPIVPVSGNKFIICDENGYIGFNSLPVYAPSAYTSYAVVVKGADYSSLGLGQVTIIVPGESNIGGRTYRTVTINGVTWLAENLDYKASEIIIGASGSSESEPRANYYNNDEATYGVNGNKYGLLYNWIAVKYLEDNKSTLMPGWHVPTTAEWNALITAVGGASIAGKKLKSTTEWPSGAGTDDFGFTAYPGGYLWNMFSDISTATYFWTISVYSSSRSYNYALNNYGNSVSLQDHPNLCGYSLRIVKDIQ